MNKLKRLHAQAAKDQSTPGQIGGRPPPPESLMKKTPPNQTQENSPNSSKRRGEQQSSDNDLAEFDHWNPMLDDYTSAKNSLLLNPSGDPLTTITGKIQPIRSRIGNVTICERFATYGECSDGRFCQRIHIDPEAREKLWAVQNTYESNKGRTCVNFTYLSPLDLKPDPKSLLLVAMANISSPSNFYVVAPFENLNFAHLSQADIDFYVDRIQQTSSVKKKIEQFHEQMAEIFGHSYRVDNLNDEIYLSQIVACKLKDGHFRRAMVVGLPDLGDYADINYRLFLIDLGVEVELPREFIYDIKANILSEPPLALNCRLDIKPAGGALNWSSGALAQFRSLTNRNRFSLCRVIDHIKADRILTVDLLDVITRASFTEQMISSGLADKCRS